MRLRRLALTRYGKFTDHSIDFGERREGEPDLHVIYGPNEAGKSTTFAAFLDLLFGIGTQSSFGFLHPYPTMLIGAALEFGAETRDFARIKRPQNSLLDAGDRPIPEAAIRAEIGGIDRDAYRTMFSLDDETLEKGGESILASKGDLGQLLFSASAGLAHLSQKLLDLRTEADGFYKFRARSGTLAELKAQLAALKAEREQFDTLASDYARLVATRDGAAGQYDEAVGERARIQARMDEIQRHLAALPRLVALRADRERLEPLADLPEAPPGWAAALPALQKEEIELAVQNQANRDDVERLRSEIEAITVDDAALRQAEGLEWLTELRARYITAEKDIPDRRLQLRQLDLQVSGILQRIGRGGEAEPQRLVLTVATTGRLRELIEARSGIDAALRNAGEEWAEARRRLAETASKLPKTDEAVSLSQERESTVAALAATVEALRSDNQVRFRVAERSRAAAQEVLDERVLALRPWHGTLEELVGMTVPRPDMLQRWKASRRESEALLSQHHGEIERLTTQIRHVEAERAGLAATTGIVTDREAAEIRARREQAWAAHRRDLDAASADVFEEALRHDDLVGAGRISHMSDLARLHQSGQALAVAQADLVRATELWEGAASALAGVDAEVAQAVRVMAPSWFPAPSLLELEDWLSRRDRVLEARDTMRAAERDLQAAQADAREALTQLRAALERAGIVHAAEADVGALLAEAQAALDSEAQRRRLYAELEERRRDVARRERSAEQAEAQQRDWAEAWSAICRQCWLAEAGAVPALGVVRETLAAVADLEPTLEKRAGLIDRIDKMEKDQAAFRDEVAVLARALGIPQETTPVLDLVRKIVDTIRQAGADQERRAQLRDQLAIVEDRQRALAEKQRIHAGQTQRMMAFFEVASLSEVTEVLERIARRRALRDRAGEAERDICEAMRSGDLASAEAALDNASRPALETELSELKVRFDDQDRRCHELFAARATAVDQVEAIGGDAKVAEIEERRRTTLLEIEDGALRYLQLRAGIAAAEQALAIYRERHRSSMMERASAAFRTISRGAYSGLAAQPGKDGETLIALSAAGGSKAADELSKGTRFQLYLALRVAGYHEFARTRRAVPFVADDIMETFDDFRAEEAFRLFADMAQTGQVIYLTHHQHLCEIARRVCPTARLHRLDEPERQLRIA